MIPTATDSQLMVGDIAPPRTAQLAPHLTTGPSNPPPPPQRPKDTPKPSLPRRLSRTPPPPPPRIDLCLSGTQKASFSRVWGRKGKGWKGKSRRGAEGISARGWCTCMSERRMVVCGGGIYYPVRDGEGGTLLWRYRPSDGVDGSMEWMDGGGGCEGCEGWMGYARHLRTFLSLPW